MRTEPLALAAALLLGPAVQGAPVPLPLNGDFSQEGLNWAAEGEAWVAEGQGHVGEPGCSGPEGAGVIGRLATIAGIPAAPGLVLAYDYAIETSDALPGDGLRVVAISPASGARVAVDIFNPNTEQDACGRFEGRRMVSLDGLDVDFAYARIEFHVWGDASGDRFVAHVDNVALGAEA